MGKLNYFGCGTFSFLVLSCVFAVAGKPIPFASLFAIFSVVGFSLIRECAILRFDKTGEKEGEGIFMALGGVLGYFVAMRVMTF